MLKLAHDTLVGKKFGNSIFFSVGRGPTFCGALQTANTEKKSQRKSPDLLDRYILKTRRRRNVLEFQFIVIHRSLFYLNVKLFFMYTSFM